MKPPIFIGSIVLIILIGYSDSFRVDSNPYRHREILDPLGKYVLEWLVDLRSNLVTFNVTVETTGWIGLGFNRKGRMDGADVVVGGVMPNGRAYLSDRHIVGRQLNVDRSQDYTLHEARESRTHTFLSFSRVFDTCDSDGNDLEFQVGGDIVSVIWAYGEDDEISYHFQSRGSQDMHLLDPDLLPREVAESPPFGNYIDGSVGTIGDWKVWTLGKPREIPPVDTSYICTFHKSPSQKEKVHVVGFRTILDSEVEERHIHHMVIHRCRPPPGVSGDEIFGPWLQNKGELCYLLTDPPQLSDIPYQYCQEFVHGWGVGGKPYFFPEHVGLPIRKDEYYMIQVHFDNREERQGLFARFSFEVFYTENLRKHDAGMLVQGTNVPGSPTIMIPPSSINYTIYGVCGSACTSLLFPKTGIHLIASVQHTHLAGRGIRALHVRNGRELPWILHDDNYNFNVQQMRTLTEERTILPGDSVIMRCVYDTTDRNGSVTTGGFRTREEMCLQMTYYYPYLGNFNNEIHSVCASELKSETYMNFLGIRNTSWSDREIAHIVQSPRRNAGLTVAEVGNNIQWTRERRRRLQQLHTQLRPVTQCPNQVKDGTWYEFESDYERDTVVPYELPNNCPNRRSRSRG